MNAGGAVDVSVVMSTYNRAPLVAQCLQALTAQILPPSISWEVIVVDNNCTDDTPAVVERARGTAPVPVRYVLERRQGRTPRLPGSSVRPSPSTRTTPRPSTA